MFKVNITPEPCFFNKVSCLQSATLLRKDSIASVSLLILGVFFKKKRIKTSKNGCFRKPVNYKLVANLAQSYEHTIGCYYSIL